MENKRSVEATERELIYYWGAKALDVLYGTVQLKNKPTFLRFELENDVTYLP
jgi:hypothetical protein